MLGMMDEFESAFLGSGVEPVRAKTLQIVPESELVQMIGAFDGWIIGDDPATRAVFEAGKDGLLKAAVKWGVGVDNVDFVAARDLGIPVVNTPGVFGREVADIAMGYIIGLARETFSIDREIRLHNGWPKPAGVSLAGKTVALVGFGDIGQQTAKRLLAAEMRVIAYDPAFPQGANGQVDISRWPLRLSEADFLVFTVPLNQQTKGLLSSNILQELKPGVRVINVGRGPVISEMALLEGLKKNIVHSVALDVYETEPLLPSSPLRNFDRCIFGSHNASNTVDAVRRVSRLATTLLFEALGVSEPVWS